MSTKWWMAYSSQGNGTGATRRNGGFGRRQSGVARTGLLASLALAFAISGCSLLPDEPEEEDLSGIQLPQISEKPQYAVTTKTLETTKSGTGKIYSKEEKTVFFTLDGRRLQKLYIKTGDYVEAGQPIAQLDVDDLKKMLRNDTLNFRKTEIQMKETLRNRDEMDPVEFEQAVLDFEAAKQALVDKQEEIDKATLAAPFSGQVVTVAVQEGAAIKAYDPIAIVADSSEMIVGASLSRSDLENVAIGMEAIVNINNIGELKGTVKQLPVPRSDDQGQGQGQTQQLDQYLLVDVPDLPDDVVRGTPLAVKIIINRKENAVVIPLAALRTIGARTYVQVAEADGSKREVDVQVGQMTSTDAEILAGLEPGQKVVGR